MVTGGRHPKFNRTRDILSKMRAPCSPHKISTAATSTPADARSLEMAEISDFSPSRPTTW
jgi:hypothetical protein